MTKPRRYRRFSSEFKREAAPNSLCPHVNQRRNMQIAVDTQTAQRADTLMALPSRPSR